MYVYTHIQVAHIRFRIHELPHCYQVDQLVFRVTVAPVLVSAVCVALGEVHLCLYVSSSVSNGSIFPGRFRVRFRPRTELLQWVPPHENPDHCQWAGFTSKTRHFNTTSLAPINYLSSDRIMTRSIRKLCNFMRSFTSRFQICDRTNIG